MASETCAHAMTNAKELVTQLLSEVTARAYGAVELGGSLTAKAVLASEPTLQAAVLRECIDRVGMTRDRLGPPKDMDVRYMNLRHQTEFPHAAAAIVPLLLRRKLPLDDGDLAFVVERTAYLGQVSTWSIPYVAQIVALLEKRAAARPLTSAILAAAEKLHYALSWIANAPERKLRERLERLYGGPQEIPIEAGEAWSDEAISHIGELPEKARVAWVDVLTHCAKADGSTPTKQWITGVKIALRELPRGEFKRCVLRWFPLVSKPRTTEIAGYSHYQPDPNLMIIDPHMQLLKGMAWICGVLDDRELARPLAQLARSAYRKVPKIGPRAVKVGNACVTALSMMSDLAAVGQLGILRAAVKFGTAQKMIEKAFSAAANRLGLPRDEVDEIGIPTYGLEEVGYLREELDDYVAEIRVNGREVTLGWAGPGGKAIKSVPAKVKAEHKEDLKELQGAVKDIAAMLRAQSQRIESVYLLQKQWPLNKWKERYLDHPLIGTIARRLIWCIGKGQQGAEGAASQSVMYLDGRLVDVDDVPVEPPPDAQVELWHPIGRDLDDVISWRTFVQRHEITQPFKQAYRELYVLTDAERRTRTYSNRFAAHILRQHQFNALCAARGWKNTLRLMVDDSFPPASKLLPQWGLRAEFWIEGIGENYGTDTNESGVFLRVSTDQVRFYRMAASQNTSHAYGGGYASGAAGPGTDNLNEPLPIEQIPPLVLSEILRDVDLFVGVASVGNDPTWQDGGPDGRYQTYWQSYSFSQLSETAVTRKAVLEALLPRLTKIRDRCSLSDRFLVVRGDLRTYKIHLGSGNILMDPNDQYLCIVRDASANAENVFLPFEGDSTLSVILSKAFLLAADTKITDETITRQINKR